MEPPTAKELTVTPKSFSIVCPRYKKATIIKPETRVALNGLMPPIFALKENNNGIDPTASITANRVKLMVTKCSKLNCIKIIISNKGNQPLLNPILPNS